MTLFPVTVSLLKATMRHNSLIFSLALTLLGICIGIHIVTPANAHEVRPAYLEVIETAADEHTVVWKQPIRGNQRLRIDPIFPSHCDRQNQTTQRLNDTLVLRWTMSCTLTAGVISVDGLNRSLADVFVRVQPLDTAEIAAVLRPGSSSLDLGNPVPAATRAYFRLGVEHIIFGYDHLLFVFGLFLLVRRNQLIQTITAFTVAHSITLALAALAGWSLPSAPVEIVIAMSICLLGLEALYRTHGRDTLSARFPWSIAFGFGLIHGFGFAGALADIGLPPGAEAWALLLFNLGVEVGQIAFVAVLIAVTAAFSFAQDLPIRASRIAACYGLGIIGAFWTLERFVASYL